MNIFKKKSSDTEILNEDTKVLNSDSLLDDLGDFDDIDNLVDLSSDDLNEISKQSITKENTDITKINDNIEIESNAEKQKVSLGETIEDIKNKITKKDKIDKFSDSESTSLYILTDRYSDRILSYFRDKGLKVTKMTNRIVDIRKELLLAQVMNKSLGFRLVVIETGLGKFTGIGTRKELVDLLGIVNDRIHISIFYTESLVKSDTEIKYEEAYLRIDWNKYVSTAATVATLLKFGESYKYANKIQEVPEYTEESLKKKRTNISNFMNSAYVKTDKKNGLNIPSIEDRGVTRLEKMVDGLKSEQYQPIRAFKVKY